MVADPFLVQNDCNVGLVRLHCYVSFALQPDVEFGTKYVSQNSLFFAVNFFFLVLKDRRLLCQRAARMHSILTHMEQKDRCNF